MDDSGIIDHEVDRNTYTDNNSSGHFSVKAGNYDFNEIGTSTDKSQIRRHQFTSINHTQWMKCKLLICWYGFNLLHEPDENSHCCALV